jgi:hypothetical protein
VQTSYSGGDNISAIEFALNWCVPTFSTDVTDSKDNTTRNANPFMDWRRNGPLADALAGMVEGDWFQIEEVTHYSLQFYMAQPLSGTISLGETGGRIANSDIAMVLGNAAGVGLNRNDTNPGDTSQISNGTLNDDFHHLNTILANTGTSMTNYIRSRSSVVGGVNYTNGTTWIPQTVVQVRWAWLAAPVAFSAISLFFFIIVAALGTHRTLSPPNWKSSSIAVLHGLDPRLHSALGAMSYPSTMDNRIKHLNVRLVQEASGWRLVEAAATEYVALENQDKDVGPSSEITTIRP